MFSITVICGAKVIAANASEAAHVLDGLLHHESSIDIREHYTDTAGAIDHVFGLCHLLGFRFAPRIRDLADRRLYVVGARAAYKALDPLIGGTIDLRVIAENWEEIPALGVLDQSRNCRTFGDPAPSRGLSATERARRSRKSVVWSAHCSCSTGSAIQLCAGGPTPASTKAKHATRWRAPYFSIVSEKSAIARSRTSATALPA
jgi:Tn3 transposase DDE domain